MEWLYFKASARSVGNPTFGTALGTRPMLTYHDREAVGVASQQHTREFGDRPPAIRKNPPRELSIDLVAGERLGRVIGRAGAS
jgi:hypothetical protein